MRTNLYTSLTNQADVMNKSFPQLQTLDTSGIDHSLKTLASIGGVEDVTSMGMAIHAVACPLPYYVIAVTLDADGTNSNKPQIQVTSHYFRQAFAEFDTRIHTDTSIKLSHTDEHCTVIAIELGGPA